jgi:hypothetical protein
MKTTLLPVLALTAALTAWAMPPAHADILQKDTPGAQGTEGTNPTHQDSNVTGPNGGHATNTNPAHWPASAHKDSRHAGSCTSR